MSDINDLLDELGVSEPHKAMAEEMGFGRSELAQGLQAVIQENYTQYDAQRRQNTDE